MNTLPVADSCCTPACDDQVVVNIPGAKGDAGDDGTNGADGINAFTLTASPGFTMPAELANVSVPVVDSSMFAVGQPVFVTTAGTFSVVSIADATHLTLKNLEDTGSGMYPANVAPGTVIAAGQKVVPTGTQGAAGSAGGGDMLGANNLSDVVSSDGSLDNLGGTTVGKSFFRSANPGAIRFPRTDATNAVLMRTAAQLVTDLALTIGTNTQAFDADLTAIAALVSAANKLAYATGAGTWALTDFTAAARALVDDASLDDMLVTLGRVKKRYGLLGRLTAVDLNAGATDNPVTISSSRYIIRRIVIDNGSTNLTTATLGVFTAAGGGGTTVAADASLAALTASSKWIDFGLAGICGTDVFTAATLYVRNGTAQGGAAVADVSIFGEDLT